MNNYNLNTVNMNLESANTILATLRSKGRENFTAEDLRLGRIACKVVNDERQRQAKEASERLHKTLIEMYTSQGYTEMEAENKLRVEELDDKIYRGFGRSKRIVRIQVPA